MPFVFESEWPELARRLHRFLAAKSVPPWLRDDIVQETGLRLMQMGETVDSRRSPWNLTVTIALRLLYDEGRRVKSHQLVDALPEASSPDDTETSAIARVELSDVRAALGRMKPSYRSVLLAEVGSSRLPDVGRTAMNVLRLRARRRLTALLERVVAPVGSLQTTLRAGMESISRRLSRASSPDVQTAAATTVSVIASLIVLATAPGMGDGALAQPRLTDQSAGWDRLLNQPVLLSDIRSGLGPGSGTPNEPRPVKDAREKAEDSVLGEVWGKVEDEYRGVVDRYHKAVQEAKDTYSKNRDALKEKAKEDYRKGWRQAKKRWEGAKRTYRDTVDP